MPHSEFRFKQFVVKQDKCAMKVGTDGVLLGAWVNCSGSRNILDIGTGTGLIALMMAQKCQHAKIDAIDIDAVAHRQAIDNFEHSPWSDRLHSHHDSLQSFAASCKVKYDVIVSNPPYFMDAHPAPSEARNVARHMDETLSIEALCEGVLQLLEEDGKFFVIFPYKEGHRFIDYAAQQGLFAHRITKVKTKTDKSEKRLMISFGKSKVAVEEDELLIQLDEVHYTPEYIELTKDYYLGLSKR